MSEKRRRVKVTVGEGYGNVHIIDPETGQDLVKALHITNLVIRFDKYLQPVAELEIVDIDIEAEANVEVETTKMYRRLE